MNITKTFFISAFIIVLLGCGGKNKKQSESKLELSESYKLELPEPSGLAINKDGNLFTVSDENSTIYTLTKTGETKDSFIVEGIDLEGITLADDKIAVIFERDREAAYYTLSGEELLRKQLDLPGDLNTGLEGITYNNSNGHFYILNEKNPRALIETDSAFTILNKTELTWATDYSGICYDEAENLLWIISDESKLISICELDGSVIKSFNVKLNQIEGIAVKGDKVYVVSDIDQCLYEYKYSK